MMKNDTIMRLANEETIHNKQRMIKQEYGTLERCTRCPQCRGDMVIRFSKERPVDGFFSCKRYPYCRGIRNLEYVKRDAISEYLAGEVNSSQCPQCGHGMIVRFKRGSLKPFLGCEQFPDCRGLKRVETKIDWKMIDNMQNQDVPISAELDREIETLQRLWINGRLGEA